MSDLSPSTTADIDSDPRVKALTWKYLPDVKTCQEILGACPLGAGHIVALKLGGGNGNNVILVIQKGVSETGQKCGGHEHLLPLQLSSHAQAAFLTELAVQTPPVHKDAGFPAWCLKRAIRLNDVVRAEQQGAVPDKVIVVYVYYVAGSEPKRVEVTVAALEHGALFNARHPVVLKALGLETHLQSLTLCVDMYDFLWDQWIPMPRGDIRLHPGEGLILKKQEVEGARNLHEYVESTLPMCMREGTGKVPWFIARRQETGRRGWPRRGTGWTAGIKSSSMDERDGDSDCEMVGV
ncbi:hypothetical protein C8T65DRAFT_739449 [Cerioporus squamosus]|nr:hypothetical protein C8T65DRAFT_739449 [Cerioporus squamosus]